MVHISLDLSEENHKKWFGSIKVHWCENLSFSLFKPFLLYFILNFLFILGYSQLGEGNGTPLQYSCLENPRDGGAW